MSFAAHKSRAFRDEGDSPEVIRKRSEGRIKTYPSATDARAWCLDIDDRRQHILDLIKANHEISLGRYIPIEVLIDTLLANKNADIEKLKKKVDELQKLLDMYSKLNLTPEQQNMLNQLKSTMGAAGSKLDTMSSPGVSGVKSGPGSARSGKTGFDSDTTTDGFKTDTFESDGFETDRSCPAYPNVPSKARPTSAPSKYCDSGRPARLGQAGTSAATKDDDLIGKDAEIISLKNALAAKEDECKQQYKIASKAIEQLETVKDIIEERDHLKRQLEASLHQMETLKSRFEDPCVAEIAALEGEIERLRNADHLSPQEEAEIIRKEVNVLKKYCAKLSKIQEENSNLKAQLARMEELSGLPKNCQDDAVPTNDPAELKNSIKDLKQKLCKYNEVMEERDRLKSRVQQLETELLKYRDLPNEIEAFRRRSEMLDNVLDERNNLQSRLDRLTGIENELIAMKKKADKADDLERQIAELKKHCSGISKNAAVQFDQANRNMNAMHKELEMCRCKAKEADVLKLERDRLRVQCDQLSAMEEDYANIVDKCRCLEGMASERDEYKSKYQEVLGLECKCKVLQSQVNKYQALDNDRGALLSQIEECECHIADQEDEIKRLVNHIDRMSQGTTQQQDRVNKALSNMRLEIEMKDSLIADSEEHIAGVQIELKTTIGGLSSETASLKGRIEELEIEICETRRILKDKDGTLSSCKSDSEGLKQLCNCKDAEISKLQTEISQSRQHFDDLKQYCTCKENEVGELQKQLQTAKGTKVQARDNSTSATNNFGDAHYELVLEQSKCAVTKIAEELGKQYQQFGNTADSDELKAENEALRRFSQEGQTAAKDQIDDLLEQLRKAKQELAGCDDIKKQLEVAKAGTGISASAQADLDKERKEKEALEAMLKNLQNQISGMEKGAAQQAAVGASAVDDALAKLRAQLEAEQARSAAAEASLKEAQGATEKLKALEAASQGADKQNQALLDELAALKQQMKDCEKELKDAAIATEKLKEASTATSTPPAVPKATEASPPSTRTQTTEGTPVVIKEAETSPAPVAVKEAETAAVPVAAANVGTPSRKSVDIGTETVPPVTADVSSETDKKSTAEKGNLATDGSADENAKLKEQLKSARRQSTESEAARALAKSQHDRDMKNMNNKYNDGIAKLQGSHEEVLKDINKEHDKEVESLRSSLRKSVSSSQRSSLICKTVEAVDIKAGVCTCGGDLEHICKKILKCGIESLTYGELQALHSKTCEATGTLLSRSPCDAAGPTSGDLDKMALLKRINCLENDLMRKQKQAQDKVCSLQMAVQRERNRLEQLRGNLDLEKSKNNELLCRMKERDNQSSYSEDHVNNLVCKCQQERGKVRRLESDLSKAQQKHRRDSETLETLRLKLENSLSNEVTLKMELDQRSHSISSQGPSRCCCQPSGTRHTTSFYTELTVPDVKSKKNYVQESSVRQVEQVSRASSRICKCKPSESSQCCYSDSDDDDDDNKFMKLF